MPTIPKPSDKELLQMFKELDEFCHKLGKLTSEYMIKVDAMLLIGAMDISQRYLHQRADAAIRQHGLFEALKRQIDADNKQADKYTG